MYSKRILIVSVEIIFLIFVFLLIIWPMMSLFIWSIAETWYWPSTLPQKIGFDYWKQALGLQKSLAIGAVSIVPAFFLSLMIAIIVVVISMLIAIPAGYALAKYRIPFGAFILFLFLMPNAFPQQPIFVNLLRTFTKFGLAGTVSGVILVHILVGLVFGVWITHATFKSIPPYMEEAARSVGASRFKAFYRITLPLAAPGLLASAVFHDPVLFQRLQHAVRFSDRHHLADSQHSFYGPDTACAESGVCRRNGIKTTVKHINRRNSVNARSAVGQYC
jgi:ABC-type glycerol-3-phosphate transport system permease component